MKWDFNFFFLPGVELFEKHFNIRQINAVLQILALYVQEKSLSNCFIGSWYLEQYLVT